MKTFFKQLAFYLPILLLSTITLYSQEINSVDLPLPKGTFTGMLTAITQDPSGYIWLASTGTGFYKYDGYHITSYKHQPADSNSVALNRIESIAADSTGNIWLGTFGKGLDKFDPSTGLFTHFRHDSKNKSSLINDSVMVILIDHEGTLWIGTRGGLDCFTPNTGKFIHYQHNATDSGSLSHNVVRVIYEDHEGTLWVGTGSPFMGDGTAPGEGGLNKLDKKTGKFTRYMHDANNPHSLIDNRVRAIFEDSRDTFWVGTAGDGLHTMNRATGTFERHLYDPKHPDNLSRPPVRKVFGFDYVADHITFIKEDATGAIWIGTLENGVNRYDPQTKKVKYYPYFSDTATAGYKDCFGWSAFTSRDGLLWMSTYTISIYSTKFVVDSTKGPLGPSLTLPVKAGLYGNLYKVDPYQKKIPYYYIQDAANSIYQEAPGIFWIATQNNGLMRYDGVHGVEQKFTYDSLKKQGISSNTITVIRVNPDGNLWLGTNGEGVDLFNPKTRTFIHHKQSEKNKAEDEGHNNVTALYIDKNANLWIGTQAGLDFMNTKTGSFTRYTPELTKKDSIGPKNIISILEDHQNNLWMGTYFEGVYQFNPQTGKLKHYLKGKNITSSIYQSADGVIWVGTKEGLYSYSSASDRFIPFIDNIHTLMDAVLHISEDKNKNLWIVTGNQLIRLDAQRKQAIHFGKAQGINPNTLAYGDNGCGSTGDEIFFGDQSGYYAFLPDELTFNPHAPQIVLTDFRISGKSMSPRMNSLVNQSLAVKKEINLQYNQDIFSFDFAAMHYTNPKDNHLIYMLKNYDETWRVSGVDQRAYYFNVPPGKYILMVRATSENGVWTEKDFSINISPPWWHTWWAYTIFSLLFIGAIWGFIYYRSRNLRLENRRLEEKVSNRTVQLKRSIEDLKSTQAQLIQREKMASLGELTAGIAHEIQNPLNFVNNFSEVNKELLNEMKDELEKGNMVEVKNIANNVIDNEDKIAFHGKRADAIVKGMLQHSRTTSGTKEPVDINALCDEYLKLSYHGLRAKDKLFNATLATNYDESIDKINIVPQDIGRVLVNLFNNAFYAVHEKLKAENSNLNADYKPTVSVETKKRNDKIEISVKDNGNGISQNIVDKIFQPFFTTKPTGQGTGLGLSLSYDIIKTHGGELKVETKEGEGSVFIIQLPVA